MSQKEAKVSGGSTRPMDQSDGQILRDGGFRSRKALMDSYGLRFQNHDDVEEMHQTIDKFRNISQQQWGSVHEKDPKPSGDASSKPPGTGQGLNGQRHTAPKSSGRESTYALIDESRGHHYIRYNEQIELEQVYFSSDTRGYDSHGEYGGDSYEQEYFSWDAGTYDEYDHRDPDYDHGEPGYDHR
ncbi:uncharacterized protein N7459_007079 [Penicillium hispanicum]|uniref:uncharacterized protein n=1 Tax=Penicillium hispanicum TaxID=1080232 RepID=UPI0025420F01|nr:uncharacterized protein N7459_007079 [Penicillium hispanicum]KAJ5578115.1 hypothetical protein N7459_007079 [Penicillium hispanicum]